MALPKWLSHLRRSLRPAEDLTEEIPVPADQEPALPPEDLLEDSHPPDTRPWWRRRRPRMVFGGLALAASVWFGLSWYLATPPPPPPLGSLLTSPPRLGAPKPGAVPLPSAPAPLPKDVEMAEPPRPELPVTTRQAPASPPLAEIPPPLPPATLTPIREAGALAEEAVRMSYTLTLAERQVRLAELRARQQKAEAERAKAEAEAKEATMWIQILERNPKLVLKARHADEPVVAPPGGAWPKGPFGVPPSIPPPPAPSKASASAKETPSPVPTAAAPASSPPPRPPTEPILVRLIDRSAPGGPEALLTIGGQTISVRAGDYVGAWQVVEVTPAGVRLALQSGQTREEQWRPLLAPFAQTFAPKGTSTPAPSQPPKKTPASPTPTRPGS